MNDFWFENNERNNHIDGIKKRRNCVTGGRQNGIRCHHVNDASPKTKTVRDWNCKLLYFIEINNFNDFTSASASSLDSWNSHEFSSLFFHSSSSNAHSHQHTILLINSEVEIIEWYIDGVWSDEDKLPIHLPHTKMHSIRSSKKTKQKIIRNNNSDVFNCYQRKVILRTQSLSSSRFYVIS